MSEDNSQVASGPGNPLMGEFESLMVRFGPDAREVMYDAGLMVFVGGFLCGVVTLIAFLEFHGWLMRKRIRAAREEGVR